MLTKVIEYEDYNGTPRKETFYFNLTETDITKMELSTAGGLEQALNKIIEAQDGKQIIAFFEMILEKAYGEKTADGRRLVKSKELFDAFMQTEAYNKLFMELVYDPDAAAAFINAIVPQTVSSKVVTADFPATNAITD